MQLKVYFGDNKMILNYHITYNGIGYTLFNEYRYKKSAIADSKTITKYNIVLLQGKNKIWYLYQSNDLKEDN